LRIRLLTLISELFVWPRTCHYFAHNLCPLTFLDVPEQAYSRATLGVYEMARLELLRDLYVWAYERSTQEYLAIKQDLAEPDPLRLTWRNFIK